MTEKPRSPAAIALEQARLNRHIAIQNAFSEGVVIGMQEGLMRGMRIAHGEEHAEQMMKEFKGVIDKTMDLCKVKDKPKLTNDIELLGQLLQSHKDPIEYKDPSNPGWFNAFLPEKPDKTN